LQHYETLADLRPTGENLLVRVTAGLDTNTRRVTWLFESLDPDTMLPPEDAMAGFLPVNDKNLHNGEGHLSYLIRPLAGLASGTQITNQAFNYFDINDPVPTPTTLHTIDAGLPTSSVSTLPGQVPDGPFTVSWDGHDDTGGSGIASYTVYVKRDTGPWEVWLPDTALTSAEYIGLGGHSYAFRSVAKDNVGHEEQDPGTAEASTSVDFSQLRVDQLDTTPSGFVAHFRRALDTSVLNLYDVQAALYGPADFTVVGAATGPVAGSLLYDAEARTLSFVKTGGPLVPDTYTVTLRSAANGIKDAEGHLLDGDGDNVEGGNYVETLTIESSTARVLSLPDFARGPAQPVNVPATGAGIPLTISDGTGVMSVGFTLDYDPALLSVTNMALAVGLPSDWSVEYNIGTPGHVTVLIFGATPLASGQFALARVEASVPQDAPYRDAGLLSLRNVEINDGTIAAAADAAVHVVAYLGDATGNGRYGGMDASYIARVALGRDNGFAAYRMKDPVLVADTSGNGWLGAMDASYLARKIVGRVQPGIPDLPSPLPPLVPGGADPTLRMPVGVAVGPGQSVTAPVTTDGAEGLLGMDLVVTYDTSRLDLSEEDVAKGSLLGAGWGVACKVDEAGGTLTILAFGIDPLLATAGSLLEITYHARGNAAPGTTALDLEGVLNDRGRRLHHRGAEPGPHGYHFGAEYRGGEQRQRRAGRQPVDHRSGCRRRPHLHLTRQRRRAVCLGRQSGGRGRWDEVGLRGQHEPHRSRTHDRSGRAVLRRGFDRHGHQRERSAQGRRPCLRDDSRPRAVGRCAGAIARRDRSRGGFAFGPTCGQQWAGPRHADAQRERLVRLQAGGHLLRQRQLPVPCLRRRGVFGPHHGNDYDPPVGPESGGSGPGWERQQRVDGAACR
jgi:hypothetical protein